MYLIALSNPKTAFSGERELLVRFLIDLFRRADSYLYWNLATVVRYVASPALILGGLVQVLAAGLFAYHPPVEFVGVSWVLWIMMMIFIGLYGIVVVGFGIWVFKTDEK